LTAALLACLALPGIVAEAGDWTRLYLRNHTEMVSYSIKG
jgi:hypothetical protein